MRAERITRGLFFAIFFAVGAAVFSISILGDELVQYYQNRHFLKAAGDSLKKLKSLNDDYDALLGRVEKDPNILRNIAPAALGIEPDDTNTVYPRASLRSLARAREVLSEKLPQNTDEPAMPIWLNRCSRQPQRAVILLCGAFLILVAFIRFGPARSKTGQK